MKVHTEINDITTNVIKVFLNDSHFKGHVILLNAVNVIQIFCNKYLITHMKFYTVEKLNKCNHFEKCTTLIKTFFYYNYIYILSPCLIL